MDELAKLKSERNALNMRIEELEKKRKEEFIAGKCYYDSSRKVYYKILGAGCDEAYYISVDLNDKALGAIGRDYDSISSFTDYDDTVEISKEEFNEAFDKAVVMVKEL